MSAQNRINVILNQKGFKKFTPTDDLLLTLNISLTRFNKIVENKVELTASELQNFSNWLNTPIQDLLVINKDIKQSYLVTP